MSTTLKTHAVRLTDDELAVLDGKCRPELQTEVDRALARRSMAAALSHLPEALAGLVADIVNEAWASGRLRYKAVSLLSCDYCNRSADYAKHKRGGRYHRAGDVRWDRPLKIGGYDFSESRKQIQCCATCHDAILPALRDVLSEVRAEIPERLLGRPCRYVWRRNMHCTACDWRGHEGETQRERWDPTKCPKCGAQNRPFRDSVIKGGDGFTLMGPPEEMSAPLMAEGPAQSDETTGGVG